ncbi:hypothetical protein B9Z55_009854 [Caenorhabditis nigoni]|uniref:Uncharacterized protein n=1 Tax=Caenorhabditis nigoni TaxID=1611254 RepID=A0A2G5UUA6_9PELO|nr:hypothetical protein B9Z55_009854 [Caenorhabditis nigoni]
MKFASIFLLIPMFLSARGAPAPQLGLGNSMQPEVHATGLIPMITGTNVPDSEEEIDAPIYDERELERVRGLVKQTAENGRDPEKALGGYIKDHPGFMSTVETLRISGLGETTTLPSALSTSPGPIFTLANGVPTVTTNGQSKEPSTTAGITTVQASADTPTTASTATTTTSERLISSSSNTPTTTTAAVKAH